MAGGRPKKEIDWKVVETLCSIQCTQEEIACHIDISVDTLERACKKRFKTGFADFFKVKRRKGFISLRRKQYELAMKGDRVMLIWLGKQYLGQSDKTEIIDDRPMQYIPPESMRRD
jgi:hypothetical protein